MLGADFNFIISGFKSPESEAQNFDPEKVIAKFKELMTQLPINAAARKGVHLCAIKKNKMKEKNFDLDRYYSSIRSPLERVFS